MLIFLYFYFLIWLVALIGFNIYLGFNCFNLCKIFCFYSWPMVGNKRNTFVKAIVIHLFVCLSVENHFSVDLFMKYCRFCSHFLKPKNYLFCVLFIYFFKWVKSFVVDQIIWIWEGSKFFWKLHYRTWKVRFLIIVKILLLIICI